MNIKELINIVRDHGVTGAGGAGFPTYAKLDKRVDTIILNCAECEPLLKVHRQLLQKHAYEIMEILAIITDALEVDIAYVAIKEAYTKTIEAVRANLEFFPKLELKLLPEVYPMGDEVILIYETTKKIVPPGSIPIEIGAAVLNAETLWNIHNAVQNNNPVSTKFLSIVGAVKKPVTVEVPIGISVEDAVLLAGGVNISDPAYIMGGPMTGNLVNAYDTVTKTTNAIIVLPKNHYVVQKKMANVSINMKRAMASCCQCQMCTDLCPRHLLGQPITPHLFMRAATNGATGQTESFLNTMFCSSCGLCEMYSCPQSLAPRTLIAKCKSSLRSKGVGVPKNIPLRNVDPMREYRAVPMDRLVARIGLDRYDVEAPLTEMEVMPRQIRLKLSQHIGAAAIPVVAKGDIVQKNQMVAAAAEGKLSIPVHTGISGKVKEVNENYIIIDSI